MMSITRNQKQPLHYNEGYYSRVWLTLIQAFASCPLKSSRVICDNWTNLEGVGSTLVFALHQDVALQSIEDFLFWTYYKSNCNLHQNIAFIINWVFRLEFFIGHRRVILNFKGVRTLEHCLKCPVIGLGCLWGSPQFVNTRTGKLVHCKNFTF